MFKKPLLALLLGAAAFSLTTQAQAATVDFAQKPQQNYTKIGTADFPTNAYQLWHYAGGYWKVNDLVIQDKDMQGLTTGQLQSDQLNVTLSTDVDLPQSVLDYLDKTGQIPSDLQLVFSSGKFLPNKIFKSVSYNIVDKKIQVQFEPKFNVDTAFYWDPNMQVTVPKPSSGYGDNDTSVWSIPELPRKHYGANLYSDSHPITGDSIVDSTGRLKPGTYSYNGGSPTETGDYLSAGTATEQEVRVGSDTFANGGAVGVEFWYPLSVQFYAPPVVQQNNVQVTQLSVSPNPLTQGGSGTATVQVVNQSSKPITTPLVFTADGNSPQSQMITLNPGQQKTITFTFSVPEKNTVYMKAEVNPSHNAPSDETTFADNLKDLAVPAKAEKLQQDSPVDEDLKKGNLSVTFPSGQYDMRFSKTTDIFVRVNNGGYFVSDPEGGMKEVPASSTVNITVSYPGYSETFSKPFSTLSPGTGVTVSVPTPQYQAFLDSGYDSPIPENAYIDMDVSVKVNPNKDPDETSFDDNEATGKVRIYYSRFKLTQ